MARFQALSAFMLTTAHYFCNDVMLRRNVRENGAGNHSRHQVVGLCTCCQPEDAAACERLKNAPPPPSPFDPAVVRVLHCCCGKRMHGNLLCRVPMKRWLPRNGMGPATLWYNGGLFWCDLFLFPNFWFMSSLSLPSVLFCANVPWLTALRGVVSPTRSVHACAHWRCVLVLRF